MSTLTRPKLDRDTFIPRGEADQTLIYVILLLSLFGLIATFTTTYYDAGANSVLRTQLISSGAGLVLFWFFSNFDYGHLRRSNVAIGIAILTILMLLAVLAIGKSAHGAIRSFRLFGFSVQPSEFAKLVMVIYGATWLASRRNQVSHFALGLIPYGLITGIIGGLIAIQPDKTTTLIVVIAAISMFIIAGASLFQILAVLGIIGGTLFLISLFGASYVATRVNEWGAGVLDINKANLQIRQAWQAFADAGLFGNGPGFSKQKFVSPLATLADTDSVLPVLTEEFGWLGLLLIILTFAIFVVRAYHIARNSNSYFGTFLVVGIVSWIVYQAMLNLAGNLSAIPLGGIPVPFISRGGSSTIALMIASGILVSVSRGTRVSIALQDPAETVINREVLRSGASRIFRGRNSRSRPASPQRAETDPEAVSYNLIGRDFRRGTRGQTADSSTFANEQPAAYIIQRRNQSPDES
ncbi:MAG: FtsW/RodA/SpoVE family cell cycle protein [Anaerolineae bacterium]|nr:FtsW/RodA/SpoVE family cell cycle protein [Anaerolineae bacterium]